MSVVAAAGVGNVEVIAAADRGDDESKGGGDELMSHNGALTSITRQRPASTSLVIHLSTPATP